MPYIEEICVAGMTVEISRYYTYRYGPGGKRGAKRKETEDAQKRANQRQAEKNLRRLMNANFCDGDYLVRLDFSKENFPPGSEKMQERMKQAMRRLRAEYKKANIDLKYIYVKEVGARGGRHIHMMLSKGDTEMLRRAWPYGGIHVDPLFTGGQYARIASYFVKYANKTEQTEGELIGKRWYASRNLVRPEPKKRVVPASAFRQQVRARRGYIVDKESICSGVSELTGYEYLSYTLIKTDKRGQG